MTRRPIIVYAASAWFVVWSIWACADVLGSAYRNRQIAGLSLASFSIATTVILFVRPQVGRWMAAILCAGFCVAAAFLVGGGVAKDGTSSLAMVCLLSATLLFGWLAHAFSRGRKVIDYASGKSR
jgi:hypothetical protein